jgi:hypothetical protein
MNPKQELELASALKAFIARLDKLELSINVLVEAISFAKTLEAIDSKKNVPGVETIFRDLLDSLQSLAQGEICLSWRDDVYSHDQELLQKLTAQERFRAVVPPLSIESLSDHEFMQYCNAQCVAAKRGVVVERMYMFQTPALENEKLENADFRRHLLEMHKQSRHIKIFTVSDAVAFRKDFVIFGAWRCSIGRESVDETKPMKLKVKFTSDQREIAKCDNDWTRLMRKARRFDPSQTLNFKDSM